MLKKLLLSFVLSLVANYLLVLGFMCQQMFLATLKEQVYGNREAGSFACHNFHADLFYCSATDFFISHPVVWVGLFAFGTYGMTIILPAIGFYFLCKKYIRK